MGKLLIELAKYMVLTTLILMPYYPCTTAQAKEPEPEPVWAKTVSQSKNERKTTLQFYYHDNASGNSSTAVQVVPAPGSTGQPPFTGFGYIAMSNAPLTVGPDPSSKVVGRARGLGAGASGEGEDTAFYMAFTYSFTDGEYNGSSISVLGLNPISQAVRELPVVGGTGLFRMARGYIITSTYSVNATSGDLVAAYNVTLFH